MYDKILKSEERASIALRSLYKSYGYLPFKMSKFEEYDLYATSKDFLVSDRIITFADTDGRLLALKPDVTLSIIKNTKNEEGKQRLYYDENVYRPSVKNGQYREILQTGVENIGALDPCDVLEMVYLAALSLSAISDNFVLDISHMGLISAVISECSASDAFRREALDALSRRSAHELSDACARYSVEQDKMDKLLMLSSLDGMLTDAVERLGASLASDSTCEALSELSAIAALFAGTPLEHSVKVDFSSVSNTSYYNGIILSGFISGIYDKVLSGGEYSGLLSNMGRDGRAVGFAIYLNLLDSLCDDSDSYDVDVLLLYSDATPVSLVFERRAALIAEGKSVSAQRSEDVGIRYKEVVDLTKEGDSVC